MKNIICSTSNETIKQLKKLQKDKSYIFLDNPKMISEAFNAGYLLEYLIVKENKSDKIGNLKSNNVVEVSSSVFEIFSNTCNSQGVVAVIKNNYKQLKAPQNNFLNLDNLQDPGNVGTLIRSALGANFNDIYLVDCVNLFNDKLVRSSMGAMFKLNVYESSKNDFLSMVQQENLKNKFNIFAGDMSGKNIFEISCKDKIGIIVGNEGNGISKEMYQVATDVVSIPMANELESLNVGVAGSILMFELNKNNLKNL